MAIKGVTGIGMGQEQGRPDGLQRFGEQVSGPALILNPSGGSPVYNNQEIRIPYADGTLVLEISATPVRDIPRVNLTYHSARFVRNNGTIIQGTIDTPTRSAQAGTIRFREQGVTLLFKGSVHRNNDGNFVLRHSTLSPQTRAASQKRAEKARTASSARDRTGVDESLGLAEIKPFQPGSVKVRQDLLVFNSGSDSGGPILTIPIHTVDSKSNPTGWNGPYTLAFGITSAPRLSVRGEEGQWNGWVYHHDGRYIFRFDIGGTTHLIAVDPTVRLDKNGLGSVEPKLARKLDVSQLLGRELRTAHIQPAEWAGYLHGLMPDNRIIREIVFTLLRNQHLLHSERMDAVRRILSEASNYTALENGDARAGAVRRIRHEFGNLRERFLPDESGSTSLEYALGPLDTEVRQGRALGGNFAMLGGAVYKAWEKSQASGESFFTTLGHTAVADFVRLRANNIGEETLARFFGLGTKNLFARSGLGGLASFGINSFTGETDFSLTSLARHTLIDGFGFGGMNAGVETLALRFLGKSFGAGFAASLLGVGLATLATNELGQIWDHFFSPA